MANQYRQKVIAKTPFANIGLQLVALFVLRLANEVCLAGDVTKVAGEGRSSDVCPSGVDKGACILLLQQGGLRYRGAVDAEQDPEAGDVVKAVDKSYSKAAAAEEAVAKNPKVAEAAKAVDEALEKVVDIVDAIERDPHKQMVVANVSQRVAIVLITGLSSLAEIVAKEPKIQNALAKLETADAKLEAAWKEFVVKSPEVREAVDAFSLGLRAVEALAQSTARDPKVIQALKRLATARDAFIASVFEAVETQGLDAAAFEAWIKAEIAVELGTVDARNPSVQDARRKVAAVIMDPNFQAHISEVEHRFHDTEGAIDGAIRTAMDEKMINSITRDGFYKAAAAAESAIRSAEKDPKIMQADAEAADVIKELQANATVAFHDPSYFAKAPEMSGIVDEMVVNMTNVVLNGLDKLNVTDALDAIKNAIDKIEAAGEEVAKDPKVGEAVEAAGNAIDKIEAAGEEVAKDPKVGEAVEAAGNGLAKAAAVEEAVLKN